MRVRIASEFPGFVISDDGRIQGPSGRWLRQQINPQGYFKVGSRKLGTLLVHQMVCTAFRGPRPGGLVTRHMNGDPRDNRAENLCWGTQTQNLLDRNQHGTGTQGEAHHAARLTADDVRSLRLLRSQGTSLPDLAQRFGISQGHVSDVCSGKRWGHLV